MCRTSGVRRALACLSTAVLFAVGCSDHQLSGQELQELKRQEILKSGESLTAEQRYAIGTIQARTQADFESKVAQIRATR